MSVEQTEEQTNQKNNQEKQNQSGSGRKKFAIIIGAILLVVLAGVYVGGAFYFQRVFYPGTTLNGTDCSYNTAAAATERVLQQTSQYVLNILGRDVASPAEGEVVTVATVSAEDISLTIPDAQTLIQTILDGQNQWIWPYALLTSGGGQYDLGASVTYDTDALQAVLAGCSAFDPGSMIAPEDAYIGEYSEENRAYELVADTAGNLLDMDAVYAAVDAAILAEVTELNLETEGCYGAADITADNEELLDNLATANTWVQTEITYDWNGREVVLDGSQIQEWITFEGDVPSLDAEAVADFVRENAKEYDTFGQYRDFVTTKGVTVTLPSAYGWKTDRNTETQELTTLIYAGAQESREPVYTNTGWVKGEDDIGDSYVEIDLSFQHLYLYQDGQIVLESDFVSGNVSNGNTTPAGIFGLTYKTRNATLRGDNYETPVSYWMPFNGNIGMHDATWRSSFGGDIYLTSGSHGCVNLPLSSAATIYEYVDTGFPVVCYYYSDEVFVELGGTLATDETEAEGDGSAEGDAAAEAGTESTDVTVTVEGEQAQ